MNSSRGERLQRHAMDLVGQSVWDSDMLERQALDSFCPKIRNDGGSLPLQLLSEPIAISDVLSLKYFKLRQRALE